MKLVHLILILGFALPWFDVATTAAQLPLTSIEDDDDDEDENQEDEDDVISGQVGGSANIYTYSLSNNAFVFKALLTKSQNLIPIWSEN